jgi:cysteine desulfurase family protein (TIGR01976 family)
MNCSVTLDDELLYQLRAQFPALSKTVGGKQAVFFDGPAGTQVPQRVMAAIVNYLTNHNANHCGVFATSVESDRALDHAHRVVAEFVGTDDPDTIAFGANMTSLTFALSRALSRTWQAGDEIVLSRLEHDANFTPWVLAAEDAGVIVRYVDINPDDCTLRLEQYQQLINQRTRLVAVGCASNAVGTINPVKQICQWAKSVGALSFLDAVHFAPHDLIDVQDWDCDFLSCSAYKFFGPHVGILYGRRELLESLQPYKLRPAPNALPGRWMTGTQNHECIVGVTAAIEYIADIGRAGDSNMALRPALKRAYESIRGYEQGLLVQLLDGLQQMHGVKIWGITRPDQLSERLPTVSITMSNRPAKEIAQKLAEEAIFVWHGNYYALPLTERIGVEPDGMVRIGLAHYNSAAEVERFLVALRTLTKR